MVFLCTAGGSNVGLITGVSVAAALLGVLFLAVAALVVSLMCIAPCYKNRGEDEVHLKAGKSAMLCT